VHTGMLWGRQEGRNHLEDPDVRGRIKLKCIFRKWDWGGGGGTDRFDLVQGGARWQAFVNAAMNLQVI
jgi:hypothetical protein